MKYEPESQNLEDYLEATSYVNYEDEAISQKSEVLYNASKNKLDFLKRAFEFVRDSIDHSGDIKSSRITRTAAEVLQYQEGICYAKSMLLAALLRKQGIPTGFCYQRLTIGDTPDRGYCIHCLNGVYLEEQDIWVRIDARGNTFGKDAQFYIEKPECEQIAFPIQPQYDEVDYPIIYVAPLGCTTDVLENSTKCMEMLASGLPKSL